MSIHSGESFLTELRNELRVSNDDHRELLTRVNEDDIIRKLRCVCALLETAAIIGTSDKFAGFV